MAQQSLCQSEICYISIKIGRKWSIFIEMGSRSFCVNSMRLSNVCIYLLSLIQIMACFLFGFKPLPDQHWHLVSWTFMNELHWNINQSTNIFFQDNSFENVICHMAAILFTPLRDNKPSLKFYHWLLWVTVMHVLCPVAQNAIDHSHSSCVVKMCEGTCAALESRVSIHDETSVYVMKWGYAGLC